MEPANIIRISIFLILSIPIVYLSRRNILRPYSHGFYRFISWECIAWLLVNNNPYWFKDPFSIHQIISWFLLIYCIYPVTAGAIELNKAGKQNKNRSDESLYAFEKTTELVQSGIYKYLRHPLYSSLLFLTWGIYFKNPEVLLTVIAVISTISLFLTAKIEEKENRKYFGKKYSTYMQHSKMFIHYIL